MLAVPDSLDEPLLMQVGHLLELLLAAQAHGMQPAVLWGSRPFFPSATGLKPMA